MAQRINLAPENNSINPDYQRLDPVKAYVNQAGTNQVKTLSTMTSGDAKAAMRRPVDEAFAQSRGNLLEKLLKSVLDGLGKIAGGVINGTLRVLSDVGNLIAGVAGGLLNGLAGLFNGFFTSFSGAWQEEQRRRDQQRVQSEAEIARNQANLIKVLDDCESFGTVTITETPDTPYKRKSGWFGDFKVDAWGYIPWEEIAEGTFKNCHIDDDTKVLVFDQPGLWDIYTEMIVTHGGVYSSSNEPQFDLELCVFYPEATAEDMKEGRRIYSCMRFDEKYRVTEGYITVKRTATIRDTVAIKRAGCKATVRFYSTTRVLPGANTTRMTARMLDTSNLRKTMLQAKGITY